MKHLCIVLSIVMCFALCACNVHDDVDTTSPAPASTASSTENDNNSSDNSTDSVVDPFDDFLYDGPAIDLPLDIFPDDGTPPTPVITTDPSESTAPVETEPTNNNYSSDIDDLPWDEFE